MSEFKKAQKELQAAQERFDKLVLERARQLYPYYDNYVKDDDVLGYEGGTMTQKECYKEALESLKKFKSVEDALADREAKRTVYTTVYMPNKLYDQLRVLASKQKREKETLIVEACAVYFEALENLNTSIQPIRPTPPSPVFIENGAKMPFVSVKK